MQWISDRFNENKLVAEPYTPEKVASILIGCVAVCLLGLLAHYAGREAAGPLWLLPARDHELRRLSLRSGRTLWGMWACMPVLLYFGSGRKAGFSTSSRCWRPKRWRAI